jgi:hypothetical protein
MASLSNPGKVAAASVTATGLVTAEAASIFIEPGRFQVQVGGGATATWKVVRTTDDVASSPTWNDIEDALGTVSNSADRTVVGFEAEGAYYNVNVTAYTSGTLTSRIAQARRPV